MGKTIVERIEENPIIAAVRNEVDLEVALNSPVTTIFLLHADIFNIKSLVDKIKGKDKGALIHIDFLEGIGKDHRAIDYIYQEIKPDGIITTKSANVKYAKDIGMFAIQRFFMIDSQSYDTTIKTALSMQPDMIEIMPGILPAVLKRITKQLTIPIIAGGLIETKEDIMDVLKSGAHGASTGKRELWGL